MIGVDDSMAKILWSIYFMEAKGYNISQRKITKYNKSEILLENNGKFYNSKRTNHTKTRYLYITDRVARGDPEIEHSPAERMGGSILNNPLQGRAFREFRAELMKLSVEYED